MKHVFHLCMVLRVFVRGDCDCDCLRFLVFLLREGGVGVQWNAHSGAIPKSLSSLSESHLHGWNDLCSAFFLVAWVAWVGLGQGTNDSGEISSSLMLGIVYYNTCIIIHIMCICLFSLH